MKYSQKMGGIAALYEAAAYVLGMVFFGFVVDSPGAVTPAQKMALLAGNQLSMQTMTLLTYVVFGAFLVVLVLALHDRLQAGSPAIMQTATAFGLIWAGLLIGSGMVYHQRRGQQSSIFMAENRLKRRQPGWRSRLFTLGWAARVRLSAAYGRCW